MITKDQLGKITNLKDQGKYDEMIQQISDLVDLFSKSTLNTSQFELFLSTIKQGLIEYYLDARNYWTMSLESVRKEGMEKYKEACKRIREIADKLVFIQDSKLKLLGLVIVSQVYSQLIIDEQENKIEKVMPYMSIVHLALSDGLSEASKIKATDHLVLQIQYLNAKHISEVEYDTKGAYSTLEAYFLRLSEQQNISEDEWIKAKPLLHKLIRTMKKLQSSMQIKEQKPQWQTIVEELSKK